MRTWLSVAAALVAAAPAWAQMPDAEDDCVRLAQTVEGGFVPVLWEEHLGEIAEVAAAGDSQACLAMFDLIRPSPPTMPATLPPACEALRAGLAEDGPPAAAADQLAAFASAIGEGSAEGCAAGLERLGLGG